jgi:hypothetical protein
VFRRPSGNEALSAWLRSRAEKADRIVVLEEALLSGRFARYAARRLSAFGLSRIAAIAVHLLELTLLFEIFSAKPFVASIALQNVTLVVDAFFWGALESLRQKLRLLGPTSESAALVTRWLTVATWIALGALALPIGSAVFGRAEQPLLVAYAIACSLRLAADIVLRTYYSGVFAYGRVHRPIWSTLLTPAIMLGVTLGAWERFGGWSFVAALVLSIVASRGVLFVFTRRGYRRARVPEPHFRLFRRGIGAIWDRHVLLAGIANLSSRLGAVVLLAALVPSMTTIEGPDDEAVLEPFAFALHLASPFLLIASQWAFVFYHDWKRLEDALTSRLADVLGRKILVCAVIVGAVSGAIASGVLLLYVPWSRAWPLVTTIVVSSVGMSIWAALQLRRFAHGEHLHQAVSAGVIVVVVGSALSLDDLDILSFYAALAIGPWIAIAMTLVLGRLLRRQTRGVVSSAAAFVDTITRAKRDVLVWDAAVDGRAASIAERIATRLDQRGAVIRTKERIVWFEEAPFATRADWLTASGGRFRSLRCIPVPSAHAKAALAASGLLAEPDRAREAGRLAAEHARFFPEGIVLHIDKPAPRRFLDLPSATRQAIWRDALRFHVGARGRSGWFVSCQTRDGIPEVVFAAPRPVSPEQVTAWKAALAGADWRLVGAGQRTSERHSNVDARVKLGADAGILDS